MLYAFYFAPFDSHGGLLVWLFGGGIGTNVGASIFWAAAGVIGGWFGKRFAQRELGRLHARHDAHEAALERIEAAVRRDV